MLIEMIIHYDFVYTSGLKHSGQAGCGICIFFIELYESALPV